MKTGAIVLIIVIIIIVIAGIVIFQNRSISEESANQEISEAKLLAGSISPYYEFNKELYDKALDENKLVFLYFYADWCPICAKEQRDATLPAFNEIEKDNLIGFRIHYNDGKVNQIEKDLAKQFGITYQHTKVILKDGKQVLKDLNSWDKDKYLEELNKY